MFMKNPSTDGQSRSLFSRLLAAHRQRVEDRVNLSLPLEVRKDIGWRV